MGDSKPHQDREIPRLESVVGLQDSENSVYSENLSTPGLLLEYIDGFTLSDLADHASREHWGKICNQAVEFIDILHDSSFLNADVRPSNIVISPGALDGN